jgi:RNA polymerase sigma-70 factor (ECF subfamily)
MSSHKPWETDLTVYEDEAELLDALRRKERLACTCLLKRFGPRLYQLAWRLTGDPDEAEDVLQDALIQACAHITDFEGRSGLGSWLHRVVVNAALARLRKRTLPTVPLGESLPGMASSLEEALADDAPAPDDILLTQELGSEIGQAILSLPDALRAAFVLRDLEGMSTSEAATALGITESALKVRLHRARGMLRAALDARIISSPKTGPVPDELPSLPAPLENHLIDRVCSPARPGPTSNT